VKKYDGASWTWYTTDEGLPTDRIQSLAVDRNGGVWVGTDAGASRFDGEKWTNYDGGNGFADDRVVSVAVDYNNTKWFGSSDNGLWRFDDTAWKSYPTEAGGLAGLCIRNIVADLHNVLWFTVCDKNNVLQSLDNGTFRTYNGLLDFNAGKVLAIAVDRDNVKWFATESGILRYDDASTVYVQDEGNPPVRVSVIGNRPNPFNAETAITFELSRPGVASLTVYNIMGQEVASLVNGYVQAGRHSAVWNGRDAEGRNVSSGIYVLRLTAGAAYAVGRLTLLK
jgi:hypothetical protein